MDAIFFAALVVVPAALLFVGVQMVFVIPNASPDWPQTEGKIESVSRFTRGTSEDKLFGAEVIFSYSVDGCDIQGKHQQSSPNQHWMEKWLSQYPVGKGVTFHYHPEKPVRGVFEPRYRHPKAFLILWSGVILASAELVVYGPATLQVFKETYHW